MKISAIIAAYNAEKYLRAAMDSITGQTLDNYEVIVINDGSTDQTQSILEEYERCYSNVIVMKQTNQGPSAARNAGMSIAKGEYLYFFDADDIVEQDALKSLYNRASSQNADVVIARYDIFNEHSTIPVKSLNELTVLDSIDRYDQRLLLTFTLWNKLFRRNLVLEHQISFPPVSYSEDGVFTLNMLFHAKVITGLDQVVLHYRRSYAPDATSITAGASTGKLKDYLCAHQMMKKAMVKSVLRDHPEYSTVEEVMNYDLSIRDFFHYFSYKEINTLLSQFYVHFWNADEECRNLIISTIIEKFLAAPFIVKEELKENHPFLSLQDGNLSKEHLLKTAAITIALYPESGSDHNFLRTLSSLLGSNFVSYLIAMPKRFYPLLKDSHLLQDNYIFLEDESCQNRNDFYQKALGCTNTKYILLCDDYFIYHYQTISILVKKMENGGLDYCIEQVYCMEKDLHVPVLCHHLMYEAQAKGQGNFDYMMFDRLWANKVFHTSFLKEHITKSEDFNTLKKQLAKKGYHSFFNNKLILFCNTDSAFLSYLKSLSDYDFDMETAESLLHPPALEITACSKNKTASLSMIKRIFKKIKGE